MEVPDILDMSATESVCPSTVAGWLWYCDEHDTHGNGDSQEEVEMCADAHRNFLQEDCHILVWQRTPHERVD